MKITLRVQRINRAVIQRLEALGFRVTVLITINE